MIWWRMKDNEVVNPYKLLPPTFDDIDNESIETLELDSDLQISEGGSATVAYGKIQFTDIKNSDIKNIEKSLLRYCELDTLAMVMIYEAFKR